MPLPLSIQNAPELVAGLGLFYNAFFDLSSDRTASYSSEGPIPWTAINQWAKAHKVKGEQRDDLHYHISRMDEVYLKFKAKKLAAANKPPPTRGKR